MPTSDLPTGGDTLGALRIGPTLLAAADGPTLPGSAEQTGTPAASSRSLAGLAMVVKDLIDVAGVTTGAGNPQFLAEATPATDHAPAVARLLRAGVSVIGKSHTDELAFSLSGTNIHYGTPVNSAAPGRVPGGSSSGSASAVAGGLVPLALATDTGGSARVPASYCGIFGFRPTHGRVPLAGVVELARSFGTVGLLAASGPILAAGGRALIDEPAEEPGAPPSSVSALVMADDLMDEADPAVTEAVARAAESLADHLGVELLRATVTGGELDSWFSAFRNRQMVEAWQRHGPWIQSRRPTLGPGIAARFAEASQVPAEAAGAADDAHRSVRRQVEAALPPGAALVFPAAATVAPPLQCTGAAKDDLRRRTLRLTCLAGLGGLPAVSLPLATAESLPVGVCLVGRANEDHRLLAAAAGCVQLPAT